MTDGNGPEVFQKCAVEWVDPRQKMTDNTGRYIFYKKGCSSMDPPSSTNELCNIFHISRKDGRSSMLLGDALAMLFSHFIRAAYPGDAIQQI